MMFSQILTVDAFWTGWAVRVVFAVTSVWLAAALVICSLRTASAAIRHRVWALSVIATLVLPALIAALPELRTGWLDLGLSHLSMADKSIVDVPFASAHSRDVLGKDALTADGPADVAPSRHELAPLRRDAGDAAEIPLLETVSARRPAATVSLPLPTLVWLALWALPMAMALAWTARSMWVARQLVQRAAIIGEEHCHGLVRGLLLQSGQLRAVELRQSNEVHSPLGVGWRRPTIVLPCGWERWPAGHLAAALAHELAHVVRRDVGWQLLARTASAVYWFHPMAWLAAWRMRVEREAACDDWALATGQPPTRYARVLLDFAEQLSLPHPAPPSSAVAMAGCRGFERRIRAILAVRRRRDPVARSVAWLLAVATLGVVFVAGTISPLASSRAGTEPGTSAFEESKAPAEQGATTEPVQARDEAPVEGDRTLLKTLLDVQTTNLTLYPKGELTVEVNETVSQLELKATVIWDGDRTYWKYRLKQVVPAPTREKPRDGQSHDAIQEGEMIEIPGELMVYFPSFLQARRYVKHEFGEGYVRELKLRPEQTWFRFEGTINLKELISPTSRRSKGTRFVVKRDPPDQVVVERRSATGSLATGSYMLFVASLAAGGNITGYEIIKPTNYDLYGKGDYSWAQDGAGHWYVRELHSQESSTNRPEHLMRDLRIKVTHFDAEPQIRNDRFQFSSFDFADGTVVEDGLVLGNRAASVG
ncbi:MAG TPA: M56 family metallopeptidase [Pirellulales bacterium]|nr:M56 family metallopeptidase [Pirellulales bacterium]